MPKSLMMWDKIHEGSSQKEKVEKARNMLKKMGKSGPEIRKSQQMKKAKNAGLLLTDTEAGAVDDDATDRIKRRKKQLEEAAG